MISVKKSKKNIMGRWSYSNKTEADHLKKVEIWWLKKNDYLVGLKNGIIEWKNPFGKSRIGITVSTMDDDHYIQFRYTQTELNGEKKDFDYKVGLTSTACNYGNKRWWFVCPLKIDGVSCGRRVGVLYKNGDYFGCRHCHDLTYQSKKESRSSKNYYLTRLLTTQMRIEKIQEEMKREYYAGKANQEI